MEIIRYILFLLIFATSQSLSAANEKGSLQGTVTDEHDGTPLIGVSVYLPELKMGTTTKEDGTYQLDNLPKKQTVVQVSYVGHQTIIQTVDLATVSHLDFVMKEDNATLGEVVVIGFTGNTLIRQTPAPVSVVTNERLKSSIATNIIDALAKEPGISQITTGGGISKPVIRGMSHNRVVVVADGIRQEGQQWGDEHGVEVDANHVHSAQILKGPASLMYGSDALAGVIVLRNAPSVEAGTIQGDINLEYQTNNGLLNHSYSLAGNQNGLVWNGRFSSKMAHDYKNKYDGRVFNSRFKEHAANGMVGLNRYWGHSHLHLSYYHINPGIVEGERDETTGKFVMPVNNGGIAEEMLYEGSTSYRKAFPFQQIDHYKAVSENTFFIGDGQLKANVGYQQNVRKEFEDVLAPDECELQLNLHTLNYDVHYLTAEMAGWRVASGLNGMWQASVNKGEEYLIPDYRLFDVGVFATANRTFGNLSLSGGLRFDNRHLHSKPLTEEGEQRFNDFTRNFSGLTGSIGGIYNLSDQANLRLNISRGFRAPNISELASNGVHEGTIRYEVGNRDLRSEKSLQLDLGFDYSSSWLSMQLALFANWIDNYIYLQKLAGEGGEEVIMDGMPAFGYTQGNARIWGGEAMVDIHPWEPLHIENTFCWVNAMRTHTENDFKYLPFIPAPRWNLNMKYNIIRHGRTFDNLYAAVEVETNFRQNHYLAAYGTETATPTYTLVNLSAGTTIKHKGKKIATAVVAVHNLTDRAYQPHLSRLKYADINPLTGRRGIFNMGRNFIVKLSVPFTL